MSGKSSVFRRVASASGPSPTISVRAGGVISLQIKRTMPRSVNATTLATTHAHHLEAAGHSTAVALNSGYHLAYVVGAGLVLVALVIAATVLEPERRMAPGAEPAYCTSAAIPPMVAVTVNNGFFSADATGAMMAPSVPAGVVAPSPVM